MTKPKTERNKLFWIFVIFLVPAACLFIIAICVEDKAPWFMAGFTDLVALFTFLLWRATNNYIETTKEYTEITKKLLKQSEEAFKQSRTAFLANIFRDLAASVKEQEQLKKASGVYIFKMLVAFGKIDKGIAEEVWELMKTWAGENTTLWEYMNTYDDSFRKSLDNL